MHGTPRTSARSSLRWSMSVSSGSCSTASWPASPPWSPAAPLPISANERRAGMTPYLKLDHVDKTFRRGSAETEVLKGITLGIEKGEFVSMIGHSGCGKTTLLNIVAGLVPATLGCVLLEDREVNEPGPDRAVVFQNHSLLPWLTVYDN